MGSDLSDVGPEGRSFEPITRSDLQRLAVIALADVRDCCMRHPDCREQYGDRLLGIALGQGAAVHYIAQGTSASHGIHDFDVYLIFARHPAGRWPARRNVPYDFGDPKFGQSPDRPDFVERRVDVMGRSLAVPVGTDPAAAVQQWLRFGWKNSTPSYLAQKTVALLWPEGRVGEVISPEVDVATS